MKQLTENEKVLSQYLNAQIRKKQKEKEVFAEDLVESTEVRRIVLK